MKKSKDSDRIIERIDSELLKLSDASKNKTPYKFFDFYTALQVFNESVLKEGRRKEYFKLKKDRYNIVFRHLMTGVYKTIYTQTLSYNGDTRVQKIRYRYKTLYNQRFVNYYETIIIEDESEHQSLQYTINGLKQSDTRKCELTLYQYLLEDCQVIFPPGQDPLFEDALSHAMLFYFHNYFLTVTPQDDDDDFLSFESYIRDLEFQRELIPGNEITPSNDLSRNDSAMHTRLVPGKSAIQSAIEDKEFETVQNTTEDSATEDQNNSLNLESLFADEYKYHCIMRILVERGHCHPVTYIWTDLKKGYKNHIANILKYLHFQNYYKTKAVITNKQIQEVALNTFRVEIALDTIKHAEITKSFLSFIPPASAIEEDIT